MNKITLCDYIAHQNPNGAISILNESGMAYERPRNKRELSNLLKQYLANKKDEALHKIAQAHPDKELLSASNYDNFSGAMSELMEQPKEQQMNATGSGCGCSGYSNFCAGCGYMGANGAGCGCGCPCRQCQGAGMMNFNGGVGERVSVTNVLLAVGVVAILYYVLKNK